MPTVRANGIEIEYETLGDGARPALLMISGLGSQLISWDDGFCAELAKRGFYVIRYDNRDSGLSTWMEAAGSPDMSEVLSRSRPPAYTLDDLAADAAGLLDALSIPAAHVLGASMGGFIAQLVAINHPDRVLSLTSIMSGPSGTDATIPTPEGASVLMLEPVSTRDERIEQSMWIRRALHGSGDPFEEEYERKRAERAIDRAYYPTGSDRQLVALLAAPGRLEKLSHVHVPALVIHGVDDVLVPIENGRSVAAAIPGARLIEIDGMGHDLPRRIWPVVLDAIAEVAGKAGALQPG